MNLRKYAKGKPCQTRIPGICNNNPETTVLAHLNGGGMGMKQPDSIAAWCCSDCHDVIDGRRHWNFTALANSEKPVVLRAYMMDAVILTQQQLLKTANKHGVTLAEAIEEWAKGLET